ncbi:ParB/RepB/Spo0J family partition protein [Seohaeicola zhoushanensis]|uniref:Chromosome partitioning protein ParB n=1 Tax=Seohaeicola zhoushanensis TaxID=1569283 RepID=A0A8J3H3P5_9RHOB|nr:ParB N-terminal domain-containing protein [Seohaeicola zhoushanensis]GHF74818.1 chromosome partitioning protein ParB [Seohaeicola zhoushanensis]
MAKRKRLTPPQAGYLDGAENAPAPAMRALMPASPPIARVAGDASARAALGEVAEALASARAEGRLIETLPLSAIDPHHLVRDRMAQDPEEMEALTASLLARGQQTPIEVVALPQPRGGHTHGLVSGLRRLSALQELEREHGARFATVKALVVAPPDRQAAYVAMVEENEIRANLSLYERARIALKAWQEGIYPTRKLALQGLFGAVSRSKRSKINSLVDVVEALDGVLRFPTAISEKLGLELAKAVEAGGAKRIVEGVARARPTTAEAEMALLARLAAERPRPPAPPAAEPVPAPASKPRAPALDVTANFDGSRIVLSGAGVTPELHAALKGWLLRQGAAG